MEPKHTFVLVEFPEEKIDGKIPMSIVSSNWLLEKNGNTYCLWPSYFRSEAARLKALLGHIDLSPNNCSECVVTVKCSSDDYQKIESKMKYLEENSTLSSSQSDYAQSKIKKLKVFHKIHNKENVSSGDSTDDEIIPEPPVVKKNPLIMTTPRSSYSESFLSPRTSSNKCSNSSCCSTNAALIEKLLTKVKTLSHDIQYVVHLIKQKNETDVEFTIESWNQIATAEELNDFETKLGEPEYFTKTCASLELVGGKDYVDTTRRILTKVISNNLALSYNWSGRNEKNTFSSLHNIRKLITVTVRKNPLSKNATQQEIESVIKSWFRNAFDRDGGRNKRKMKS